MALGDLRAFFPHLVFSREAPGLQGSSACCIWCWKPQKPESLGEPRNPAAPPSRPVTSLVSKTQTGQSCENRPLCVLKVGTGAPSPRQALAGARGTGLNCPLSTQFSTVWLDTSIHSGMDHLSHWHLDGQQGNHMPWDLHSYPSPFLTRPRGAAWSHP